jgi:hypothetical protein
VGVATLRRQRRLSRNSLQVVDFIDLICNGLGLAQAVAVCGDAPAKGTSCSPTAAPAG